MAHRIEENQSTGEIELVIDGWEQGISDSPEMGIADMRNINNDSIPGVALCNYKLKNTTQIPFNTTFVVVGNTISITGAALTDGCSVKFTGLTGTGLTSWVTADSIYNIYYLDKNGAVYSGFDPANGVNTQVTLTAGSGTVTTINMGIPKGYAIDNYYYGNNSIIHHEMIELPEHEYEPDSIYMSTKKIRDNERHLTTPQMPEFYKCTCGEYSLKPVKSGLRHQSIIECQCSQCRVKIFVEIPYRG